MSTIFFNSHRFKQIIADLFANRKSLYLDGINQYMNVADSNSLSFGNGTTDSPFSMSIWLDTTSSDAGIIMGKYGGTNREYILEKGSSNSLIVALFDSTASKYIGAYTPANALTPYLGTYAHIAVTYNGSGLNTGLKIYINGSEIPTTKNSGGTYVAMHNTADTFIISSPTYNFDGNYDQPIVWNKELSVAEIREAMVLRDMTVHSAYANIVSWWEFEDEDISGTTVADKIGTNNGTLMNSATNSKCIAYPYDYQLEAENHTPFQNSGGGWSFDFDGVNDYINFGNVSDFNVEYNTPSSYFVYLKDTLASGSYGAIGSKSLDSGTYRGWDFRIQNTRQLYFRITNTVPTNTIDITTTNPIQKGSFKHVGFTYDGSSSASGVKIYVDGVSVPLTIVHDTLSGTTSNTALFQIGRSRDSAANLYKGTLSDPIFFDKELSASEVEAMYNNHSPRNEMNESLSGNILGYWRGKDSTTGTNNVIDLSGNGNHGTMTNMTADDVVYKAPRETVDLKNNVEGSFYFDGVNDWVDMNDGGALDMGTSDITVSAWIKTTAYGSYLGIAGKHKYASASGRYGLFFDSGKVWAMFSPAGTGLPIGSVSSINDSKWHNCVATYDRSGYMVLYVDGVKKSSLNISTHSAVDFNLGLDFAIGQYFSGSSTPDRYFNGNISNVSLISKALSPCEVQELYNDGSPVDISQVTFASDFISYWGLNQNDNPTTTGGVIDQVGSNNGTGKNMVSGNLKTTDYPTN